MVHSVDTRVPRNSLKLKFLPDSRNSIRSFPFRRTHQSYCSWPALAVACGSRNTLRFRRSLTNPFHSNTIPRHNSRKMPIAAVIQLCSTADPRQNFMAAQSLVIRAAESGAQLICLPEASDFISDSKEEAARLAEPLESNQFVAGLARLAAERGIWISVGIHEKSDEPSRLFNTSLLIDSKGAIVQLYRKIHMFDIELPGVRLMESSSTKPGTALMPPVPTPCGAVAQQICYDLRFPEAALALRQKNADIITYPSAFTVRTGYSHWETLVRARAIETQTYVLAAAQIGKHNPKRESYGHSMIVDPWGTIIATCSDKDPAFALAHIDLDYLQRVRMAMPVMDHRRKEVYNT